MKHSCKIAALFFAAWCQGAAAQEKPATIPAAVRNIAANEIGAGFIVRNGPGCTLVTAAHVIAGAFEVEVSSADRPLEIVKLKDSLDGLDVALMPLHRPADACPAMPTEEDIVAAIQKGSGILMVGLEGGQVQSIAVTIDKASPEALTVRSASPIFQLVQGTSGGVIVMDGVPVAIQSDKSVDDSTAKAIRLDYAARVLGPARLALGAVVRKSPEELTRAQAVLRQAMDTHPLGDIGQVGAVQALAAAGKQLSGLSLAGVGLTNARFQNVVARETDFTLSDLSGSLLERGDFSRAILDFASLSTTHLIGVDLSESIGAFIQGNGARFDRSKLARVGWRFASLKDASFAGADLQGASFAFADLRGADFRLARFTDLVLAGSDLRGAKFDQVDARSIDVTGALFEDVTFPKALLSRLCATRPSGDGARVHVFEEYASGEVNDLTPYTQAPLDRGVDRFFPKCPSREGLLGLSKRTMVSGTFDSKFGEYLDGDTSVYLPRDVVNLGLRRTRIRSVVSETVATVLAANHSLPTSNAVYRDRATLVLQQVSNKLTAQRFGVAPWLNAELVRLWSIADRIAAPDGRRLAFERSRSEARDANQDAALKAQVNWAPVFPSGFREEDLTQTVLDRFATWATDIAPLTPAAFSLSTLPVKIALRERWSSISAARPESISSLYERLKRQHPQDAALSGNVDAALAQVGDRFRPSSSQVILHVSPAATYDPIAYGVYLMVDRADFDRLPMKDRIADVRAVFSGVIGKRIWLPQVPQPSGSEPFDPPPLVLLVRNFTGREEAPPAAR